LFLDCANGVGGVAIKHFKDITENSSLKIEICNDDKPELLNEECGAEYVHKD